jgi:RNA polymerase-binding protein DksA
MARKPTDSDLSELRQSLMKARAVLTGDINLLQEEALGASTAAEGLEAEESDHHVAFNLELLERDGSALREVDDALDRMDNGTYGRCESCEEWIPKMRLKVVPHARLCIECQRSAEKRGR